MEHKDHTLKREFQSTLSARRATATKSKSKVVIMISIHALREESDSAKFEVINVPKLFQSTLSARRATAVYLYLKCLCLNFNPRSPRGERQIFTVLNKKAHRNFNPRSPRGERLKKIKGDYQFWNFNPRSPRGERPY